LRIVPKIWVEGLFFFVLYLDFLAGYVKDIALTHRGGSEGLGVGRL
jgi:hypothetical protein